MLLGDDELNVRSGSVCMQFYSLLAFNDFPRERQTQHEHAREDQQRR